MATAERTVEVRIEIARGGRSKYEYDHEAGCLRLDRVLHSSVHYPTDYGFIPETLTPVDDELDILLVTYEPTVPGCLAEARPIGVLETTFGHGPEHKILAVHAADPRWDDTCDLEDLAPHWLREIETFFATYKHLESHDPEVRGWHDATRAWAVIDEALTRAREQAHGAPA